MPYLKNLENRTLKFLFLSGICTLEAVLNFLNTTKNSNNKNPIFLLRSPIL